MNRTAETFDKYVCPAHFVRYVYGLGTVRPATSATYAMIGTTRLRQGTIILGYEAAGFSHKIPIIKVLRIGQATIGKRSVVCIEYGRDINAVWAWHAVGAVVARYGSVLHECVAGGKHSGLLAGGQRLERGEYGYILLKMLTA